LRAAIGRFSKRRTPVERVNQIDGKPGRVTRYQHCRPVHTVAPGSHRAPEVFPRPVHLSHEIPRIGLQRQGWGEHQQHAGKRGKEDHTDRNSVFELTFPCPRCRPDDTSREQARNELTQDSHPIGDEGVQGRSTDTGSWAEAPGELRSHPQRSGNEYRCRYRPRKVKEPKEFVPIALVGFRSNRFIVHRESPFPQPQSTLRRHVRE
jgi:hypothetical protein